MKLEMLDHGSPKQNIKLDTNWLKHFTRTSPSDKMLRFINSHVNHTQNIDVIDLARQNKAITI